MLLTQRMRLSDAMSEAAANLKQQFMVTSSVYGKYRQLWSQRERLGCSSGDNNEETREVSLAEDDPYTQNIFTFGWYLYINSKSRFKQVDMVSSFHMMLACLEFVIRQGRTPAEGASPSKDNAKSDPTSPGDDWSDEKERELAKEAGCALAMLSAAPPPSHLAQVVEEGRAPKHLTRLPIIVLLRQGAVVVGGIWSRWKRMPLRLLV